MLTILLLYFIWKHNSDLAKMFNKTGWHYGLIGILVFYLGFFVFGIALVIFSEMNPEIIPEMSDFILGLVSIPFGILCNTILYKYLKRKWVKKELITDENILDAEMMKDI